MNEIGVRARNRRVDMRIDANHPGKYQCYINTWYTGERLDQTLNIIYAT